MGKPITLLNWLGHEPGALSNASVATFWLSRAAAAKFPVLPGFIITDEAFRYYLSETRSATVIQKSLQNLDLTDSRAVARTTQAIKDRLTTTPLPVTFTQSIDEAYDWLMSRFDKTILPLTVSLAVEEDTVELTNVRGKAALKKAIATLYAAAFSSEQLLEHRSPATHLDRNLSLLIQLMIPAERSGHATLDTIKQTVRIDAIAGELAPLEHGTLTPDTYLLDRDSLTVLTKDINRQPWKLVASGTRYKHLSIPAIDQTAAALTDWQIQQIGLLIKNLATFFGTSVSASWTIDLHERVWLTSIKSPKVPAPVSTFSRILIGQPATPFTITGPAHIITHSSQLTHVSPDTIVVVESEAMLRHFDLEKAGGYIIETGTSHSRLAASLLALGKPALYGAKQATHRLTNGSVITLDGSTGTVYAGKADIATNRFESKPRSKLKIHVHTAFDQPLTRTEAIDGIHYRPQGIHFPDYLSGAERKAMTDQLAEELLHLHQAHQPLPLYYHPAHPPLANIHPLLANHGARYYLDKPSALMLQLDAIRKAREHFDTTNLHLVLPHVRTYDEFLRLYHILMSSGLRPGQGLKIWITCHTPAMLRALAPLAADPSVNGILIDLDTLRQLSLGIDLQHETYRNEYPTIHDSLLHDLAEAATTASEHHTSLGVTGSDLSNDYSLLELLTTAGFSTILADSDEAAALQQLLASIDHHVGQNRQIDFLHED